MALMSGAMSGAMPGVSLQILGVHSARSLVAQHPIAIDRRDYGSLTPIEEPHHFCCTNLVHYTDNKLAEKIGLLGNDEPFCFKPKQWRITRVESLKLSWWSPLPPDDWTDIVDDNLPNIWNEFEDTGNSPALNGPSICGPVGFVSPWKSILQQYAISRQRILNDLEFRTMGTFRYRAEIMYAVLVCMRGDIGVERFPIINPGGTEAFEPGRTHECFTWKVYSTVGFSMKRPMGVEWTWDHISFGFNCPTSDLNIQPQFCSIVRKNSTENVPLSRTEKYEDRKRTPECMVASLHLIDCLEAKIRRARLYC